MNGTLDEVFEPWWGTTSTSARSGQPDVTHQASPAVSMPEAGCRNRATDMRRHAVDRGGRIRALDFNAWCGCVTRREDAEARHGGEREGGVQKETGAGAAHGCLGRGVG